MTKIGFFFTRIPGIPGNPQPKKVVIPHKFIYFFLESKTSRKLESRQNPKPFFCNPNGIRFTVFVIRMESDFQIS